MEMLELIKNRRSVRHYKPMPIESSIKESLLKTVSNLNSESGLNMQIFFDEPDCFDSFWAHYGKFSGVSNYLVLLGKKKSDLEEKSGFFGEKFVLEIERLGLNSCWVALTHGKTKAVLKKGEKVVCVIAFGYGDETPACHKIKKADEVSDINELSPDWFKVGVEASLLAPTALNQQKFFIRLNGEEAEGKALNGFYTKIDFGIVKYHFELVSGHTLTLKN